MRRLRELRVTAEQTITEIDVPYYDVAELIDAGETFATDFADAGFNTIANALRQGSAKRVDIILARDLPEFVRRWGEIPAQHETVKQLAEQEAALRDIAADIPGFSAYQQAVQARLTTIRQQVCEAAGQSLLKQARSSRSGESPTIMVGEDSELPVGDFVCALYEGGHLATQLTPESGANRYMLKIVTASDKTRQFRLTRVQSSAQSNAFIGDQEVSDQRAPLDSLAWFNAMGELIVRQFSGEPDAQGITACDTMAADPHDAGRRTQGVQWQSEEVDPKRLEEAIDACIAAVEFRPDDTTVRYQLGRMLMIAGDTETARGFLSEALKSGYGPAAHAMAQIVINETRESAFYDAVDLYRVAARKKYKPAIAALAELEPDGVRIFRPMKPPTSRQVSSAFPKRECTTNFGVQVCKEVINAEIKSCFQTKASEFSCEWRPIMRCSTSLSSAHNAILQAGCNNTEFGFGTFRKNKNKSWTFIPE